MTCWKATIAAVASMLLLVYPTQLLRNCLMQAASSSADDEGEDDEGEQEGDGEEDEQEQQPAAKKAKVTVQCYSVVTKA